MKRTYFKDSYESEHEYGKTVYSIIPSFGTRDLSVLLEKIVLNQVLISINDSKKNLEESKRA
jgi:hypothetical protein